MAKVYCKLSSLIEKIVSKPNFTEDDANAFAEEIYKYYESGNPNLYSETYRWLSHCNQENYEYLLERLEQIQVIFDKRYPDKKEIYQKLRDYVSLEALRATDFSDIRTIVTNAKKQIVNAEKLQKDIEENKKETNTQSVTVLSIFTGIAMTFFAGFSLLGSAFNALQADHFWDIIIILLVVGIILFNTVYALIAIACRISGVFPTQSSHEDCSKCARPLSCDEKYKNKVIRRWFNKFKNKYPFALATNMFLTVLLVISALLFIA